MTPGAFTLDNAVEMIDDSARRQLGDRARHYAECGQPPIANVQGARHTYFDCVLRELELVVWLDAYRRRKARLERMAPQ